MASNQLNDFKKKNPEASTLTESNAAPIADKLNIITIGPRGPQLMQDRVYLDEMGHFDRERIPERVVHAKGAGAFGHFECTNDVTRFTKLAPFREVGKKTPVAVRFSTVAGESGSADTVRDVRGFGVKFYTEEGNWDLVGNNTPIFFVRDPMLFPSFIHTQKRNPETHVKDPNAFWDFAGLRPETTHQYMILFSDRGIPDGHRHMNGYGSHTYKLINNDGEPVYCKFHFKTEQGIKNIPAEKASIIAGTDPDYSLRDLYNAIAKGDYPSWTLYLQIMTFDQAERYEFNPFDLTKIWSHKDYPLIPVGKMTLDRNAKNYFAEIEQLSLSPSSMIPGVEPSPDKMLQGRLFSYPDTHFHRLGPNYLQIPVNCPLARSRNYQRDGLMTVNDNQAGAPNYYPNSFNGPIDRKDLVGPGYDHFSITSSTGDVKRYNSADEDNFTQPGIFWRETLKRDERERLIENIATHMKDAMPEIRKRAIENFRQVDVAFGHGIEHRIAQLLDN